MQYSFFLQLYRQAYVFKEEKRSCAKMYAIICLDAYHITASTKQVVLLSNTLTLQIIHLHL